MESPRMQGLPFFRRLGGTGVLPRPGGGDGIAMGERGGIISARRRFDDLHPRSAPRRAQSSAAARHAM